jgi:O-antigen/teichoic acid export membrane protein
MLKTLRAWWHDNLLRGVLKNSSFLFSSNTISAALAMINSIFATRLLGIEGLGLVTIVQTFVTNVNRLLSFRMSEVVVKYLGQVLAGQQKDQPEATAGTIGGNPCRELSGGCPGQGHRNG